MSHTETLLELLREEQARRCAYGTREGDGRTCDCKFSLMIGAPLRGEMNGCCEMRTAIRVLAAETSRP